MSTTTPRMTAQAWTASGAEHEISGRTFGEIMDAADCIGAVRVRTPGLTGETSVRIAGSWYVWTFPKPASR